MTADKVVLAVAAVGAGLLFLNARAEGKTASGAPPQTPGELQRMAGVQHLFDTSKGQQAGVDAAISGAWVDLAQATQRQQEWWT